MMANHPPSKGVHQWKPSLGENGFRSKKLHPFFKQGKWRESDPQESLLGRGSAGEVWKADPFIDHRDKSMARDDIVSTVAWGHVPIS